MLNTSNILSKKGFAYYYILAFENFFRKRKFWRFNSYGVGNDEENV